jgi:hypothetical protein
MQDTRCPKEPHAQRSWPTFRFSGQVTLPAQSEDLRTEVWLYVVGRVSPTTSGSSNAVQSLASRRAELVDVGETRPTPSYFTYTGFIYPAVRHTSYRENFYRILE